MYKPKTKWAWKRWVICNENTSQYYIGEEDRWGDPMFRSDMIYAYIFHTRREARYLVKGMPKGCRVCKMVIDTVGIEHDRDGKGSGGF